MQLMRRKDLAAHMQVHSEDTDHGTTAMTCGRDARPRPRLADRGKDDVLGGAATTGRQGASAKLTVTRNAWAHGANNTGRGGGGGGRATRQSGSGPSARR